MSVDVFYLGKGVGVFTDDRVFVTRRRREHIFRKFNGLGISYGLLRDLMNKNCRLVKFILDNGDGTESVYETTPQKFLVDGNIWVDRQQDTQRILAFDKMDNRNGLNNY